MSTGLLTAALLGASAVALGAFGAHGLSGRVDASALAAWRTAAQYHLVHSVAILALQLAARGDAGLRLPAALLAAGVVLFSGSIYALVLGGPRWLGPVTPLGGLTLMAGWLALAWRALSAAR